MGWSKKYPNRMKQNVVLLVQWRAPKARAEKFWIACQSRYFRLDIHDNRLHIDSVLKMSLLRLSIVRNFFRYHFEIPWSNLVIFHDHKLRKNPSHRIFLINTAKIWLIWNWSASAEGVSENFDIKVQECEINNKIFLISSGCLLYTSPSPRD